MVYLWCIVVSGVVFWKMPTLSGELRFWYSCKMKCGNLTLWWATVRFRDREMEIGDDCFSKSLMIYKENTKEVNVKWVRVFVVFFILMEKQYQTPDTVLNYKIKHLVARQKYSAVSHPFNSLLSSRISVWSCDKTVSLLLNIVIDWHLNLFIPQIEIACSFSL